MKKSIDIFSVTDALTALGRKERNNIVVGDIMTDEEIIDEKINYEIITEIDNFIFNSIKTLNN